MFRSSAARWIIAVIAIIAALGLLRYKPWQRGQHQTADQGNEPVKSSTSGSCLSPDI